MVSLGGHVVVFFGILSELLLESGFLVTCCFWNYSEAEGLAGEPDATTGAAVSVRFLYTCRPPFRNFLLNLRLWRGALEKGRCTFDVALRETTLPNMISVWLSRIRGRLHRTGFSGVRTRILCRDVK